MAFPTGWPPRLASGRYSLRFFQEGTSTASFEDNAFLFKDLTGAVPLPATPVITRGDERTVAAVVSPEGGGMGSLGVPHAMAWSGTIRICNDDAVGGDALEFSFDGTNVHGKVLAAEELTFRNMHEAGISVRGVGGGTPLFRIFAW